MQTVIAMMLAALGGAPTSDADADEAALQGRNEATSYYDFEDDSVEGEVLRPEGVNLYMRSERGHESMLRLRSNFIPELEKLGLDI
jgi:hypothetical protein